MKRHFALLAAALTILAMSAPVAAAAPSSTAEVVGGILQIRGGQGADQIALRLSATDTNVLQVDAGDDGSADFAFNLRDFETIAVEAGNGNDAIRIDQANGVFTTTKPTRVDGGNGNDTMLGGSGAELFVGGRGDDFVDGNGGADTALLGAGDDVFVWDPGDASDVVEGAGGADTLVFNGSGGNEIMAASAHGGRVRFTRNLGTIVMDLDDVESIDVRALGGSDTVTVNDVRGTDLQRVDVDLAEAIDGAAADRQADTVTVIGTAGDDSVDVTTDGAAIEVGGLSAFVRITHADADLDTLAIDTLGGDDAVAIDPALGGLIQHSVL